MRGIDLELAVRLSAGWRWIGPAEVDGTFELRAADLPDFLLAGESREEIFRELPNALRAYFLSFVEQGQPLPSVPPVWLPSLTESVYMELPSTEVTGLFGDGDKPSDVNPEDAFSAGSEQPSLQLAS